MSLASQMTLLASRISAEVKAVKGAYAKNTQGGAEIGMAFPATTGTVTGDLSLASVFNVAPSGNISLAFTNVPAPPAVATISVKIAQGATVRTVAMPSGAYPLGAAYPTQVANKRCWLTLITDDGGTSWGVSGGVEQ